MKKPCFIFFFVCLCSFGTAQKNAEKKIFTMSKSSLDNKIRGGWAGQTIGVTFGGPYEFRFQGTFIGDYQPLLWYDGYLKETMINNPGLYDDLYMDLSFVDVMEKYGLDVPVDSFSNAFAHAGYSLWHANQAARYNILQGMHSPATGFWKNNPHADCIDYQIESDFAGLMSPGMPNTAAAISDKIGHIMNYGDGWYGGVFVSAMYSLAFTTNDLEKIIGGAISMIPKEAMFHQCIRDVMEWHKKYPGDWKQTWLEVQRKWADDTGCPDGVFAPFNIDARVNAAYVVIGLLYGKKDFTRSLEITTRCGQDADCNPSTVGGILGCILGYEGIPAYWKMGLKEAEAIDFKYTTMSLNTVYRVGLKQALENIRRHGGSVNGEYIRISLQDPVRVRWEKSFEGIYPVLKIPLQWNETHDEISFAFEGTGFVLRGEAEGKDPAGSSSDTGTGSGFVFQTELYVDGKKTENILLPVAFHDRRHEICWNYDLPKGRHEVRLKILNRATDVEIKPYDVIVYSDHPAKTRLQ